MKEYQKFISLLSILSIGFGSPQKIPAELVSSDQAILSSKISFKFSNPEELPKFLASENASIASQIVRNLQGFKREMENSYVLQEAFFEFIFQDGFKGDFSNCIVKAFHSSSEPTASDPYAYVELFRLDEVRVRWGKVDFLRFQVLDEKAVLEEVFDVYNVRYDLERNITDRVILKSVLDSSLGAGSSFHKFLEGKVIQYQGFSERSEPASFEFKSFILDKDGTKVWTAAKKSFNRLFNEQGLVTQETTQETTYSYSGLQVGTTYAIYNVQLHPKGELSSFEVVFPKREGSPAYTQPGNLEINFERNNLGDLLGKMVREYRIVDGIKGYSLGKWEEITRGHDLRVRKTKEVFFDIKPGTSGMRKEEQILKEGLEIWNLAYNENGEIISKRILETRYGTSPLSGEAVWMESLKDIQIVRDQGKLKNLGVNYYDYNDAKSLALVRRVTIDVLEYMPTQDPAKIKLIVDSPQNPQTREEEIFIQDCNYMINEAVFGKLFDPKPKRMFDVHLVKVSEEGDILDAEFFDYRMEGDRKIYLKQEAQANVNFSAKSDSNQVKF